VYCNVTAITSEQLSNGVRVIIKADGEMKARLDVHKLLSDGGWEYREFDHYGYGYWPTERFRRLPIRISNAKSSLGSGFIPVGKYPVSHVEISIPEWAEEGVGLEVAIVNYLGFATGDGDFRKWRYEWFDQRGEGGDTYVVTWRSDRFAPPAPPATPKDLPAEVSVSQSDGGYSVLAVNARLQEVVSAIGKAAGFPVMVPPDSDLRVSLHLDNVSAAAALNAIAAGCGLSAGPCPTGGWMMAAGVDAAQGYGAASSRTIPLRYLRAVDAVDLLPSFLLAYVRPDEGANAVVAAGPQWMLDRVAADLAKLDTPPPAVSLEVVAIEYTSAEALSRSLNLARALGSVGTALDALSGEINFEWLGQLSHNWSATLQAVEARSTGRLRSRATVSVGNGHRAELFAGQQRTIVIERYYGGGEAQLEQVDIGTSLGCQPLVGSGAEVVLHLEMAVNTLAGKDVRTGLPVVERRNADSVMRVRDGETILVAGMESQEGSTRAQSLPVLGEAPVIGQLFRAVVRSRSQTRLAVFVTAHLVRTQQAAEGVSHASS
jgi:type IV pilus assembly protein PilQ